MFNLLLTTALGSKICTDAQDVLKVVGMIATILKIGVPLVIIVLGLVDLAKAALSSKPEDIKKSLGTLVWRIVGSILIFLLPSIIMLILRLFGVFNTAVADFGEAQWNVCYSCIVSPNSAGCYNCTSNPGGPACQ